MQAETLTSSPTGTLNSKMKRNILFCTGLLLLGALAFGCKDSAPEDEGPKLGEVKTADGKPLPPEAKDATRPKNPFEAAGVSGPGGMKKGGTR